jgi:hypothetical protein
MSSSLAFFQQQKIMEIHMAEIRETYVVKKKGDGNGATPWLAFIGGALLIAVVAVFLLNAHGRVTGPNGTLDLNLKSPVATAPASPAPTR